MTSTPSEAARELGESTDLKDLPSTKRKVLKKKTFSPTGRSERPHTVFERYRRSRVSRAIAEIVLYLPVTDIKPDKATVLEAAAQFLDYFHQNVGNTDQFDAEYLRYLSGVANESAATTKPNQPSKPSTAKISALEGPIDLSLKSKSLKRSAPTPKMQTKKPRTSALTTTRERAIALSQPVKNEVPPTVTHAVALAAVAEETLLCAELPTASILENEKPPELDEKC